MGTWTPGPGATAGNDTFTGDATGEVADGLAGDDTLNGNGGDDTLTGGDGADTVNGGAGDDVLVINNLASLFGDTFAGGADTDTIRVSASGSIQEFLLSQATLSGIERIQFASTTGDNAYVYVNSSQFGAGLSTNLQLTGSAITDLLQVIMSAPGSFSTSAFTFVNWGANDLVVVAGSTGDDTITGSAQRDWFLASQGNDSVSGGGGDDDLRGQDGNDSLFGGDGADRLEGGAGVDSLFGNAGIDILIGGAGADFMGGGDGIDAVHYFDSTAVAVDLQAGTGLFGDAQGDTYGSIESVVGSPENDVLYGRDFVTDTLAGFDGNDVLMGRYGADNLFGGAGSDTIAYVNSLTAVDIRLFSGFAAGGEANGDFYTSIENIVGSEFTDTLAGDANANIIGGHDGNETITGREGADLLFGDNGNDTLLGGADDDTLIGGLGADTLGGGGGNDTADYAGSNAAVTVNLQTGVGSGGHAQGDALVSIENVVGSAFGDFIIGKNNVWDNIFDGRGGNDALAGGLGNDTFVFRINEGSDTITDFAAGGASGDVVSMAGWGAAFDSFAETMAVASQVGAHVEFNFGNGQTLTLTNVTLGNLNAGDFIFGP